MLDGPVEDVLRARPLHYDAIVADEGIVPAELARELQPLAALMTPAEVAYAPGALLARRDRLARPPSQRPPQPARALLDRHGRGRGLGLGLAPRTV